MSYESISYRVADGVAFLQLNRPHRLNAMTQALLVELQAAMDEAETDAAVRALVVSGAGKAFSSGFDLTDQLEARPSGVAEWRPILRNDFEAIVRFWRFPKPTIAAVRGPCLAGACELALACDMTIASETAVFGEPELKFGAGIVVMILPWIVGPKLAKEIILTGVDGITAKRAYEMGMVNRLVADADLESEAQALGRHLAVIDPNLMRETKRAINRSYEIMGLGEALEAALDSDLLIEGEGSPDKIAFMQIVREKGLRAALDWRDARFGKVKA
ncbi:MAG: enoyl-CoA hydratase-related protein [Pseudomonadota bacterium]